MWLDLLYLFNVDCRVWVISTSLVFVRIAFMLLFHIFLLLLILLDGSYFAIISGHLVLYGMLLQLLCRSLLLIHRMTKFTPLRLQYTISFVFPFAQVLLFAYKTDRIVLIIILTLLFCFKKHSILFANLIILITMLLIMFKRRFIL